MNRLVEEKNRQIAKRLTAMLVAVVFVFGMMYMPAEIYAVETDSAGDAVVTDTTGTSDEAEKAEINGEVGENETLAPDETTIEDSTVEEVVENEELATGENSIDELTDALTVDLDSLDESDYDGFIYKLADDTTKSEIKEMEKAIDDLGTGQEVEEVVEKEAYVADSIETIAEVVSPEQIEYIEPNYIVKAMGTSDPEYEEHGWYLDIINAPYVWDKGMRGEGIVVAVLDSGVKMDHKDFESNTFTAEHNTIDEGDGATDVSDNSGHGTAVTGIIAAAQNNGEGLTGVMPKVNIMPVKVMDYKMDPETGKWKTEGTLDDVVEGIEYAANNGANVINMSLGTDGRSSTLEAACNAAAAKGVILVAAAGNEAQSPFRENGPINPIEYPAAFGSVVSVGSVDSNESWSYFSNYNKYVAIAAPGEELKLTWKNGSYTIKSGTSFAAPQVAAMAAMVKQMDRSVDCTGFMKIIAATSTDKGVKGFDPYFGYGLMNLKRAYDYMAGDISMYDISLSGTAFTYNGGVKTPSVTVKKANKAISANYYRTTYAAGRTAVGTYKVTVTGINGYKGTKTLSFNINPPLVKGIKAPKRGKKKLTVRWGAMSKKQKKKIYKNVITGYQVRVSTSSNFANARYASVKGIAKTKVTIKGLQKKTTYFVQYRSYKTVGSATYYSNWSSVKKAKTK